MFLELVPWLVFLAFVIGMLALDLGVFHREAHAVSRREALAWSAVWIGLAIAFNVGMYIFRGGDAGLEWTTGYLIEKSLSVDNVFVFLLIFSTFAVPPRYQHRVLFWGILGALVTRMVLILVGAALITNFTFVIYLFGAFLIFTGLKFLRSTEEAPSLDSNRLVRLARRLFPTTEGYEGQKFFTRRNGVRFMTPLFLVLLLIESTDIVFAVDSIPAIYAVTDDPFIVFTSNIFAILGLRALYFVLAGYLAGLAYLKPALAAVLVFVGAKMLLVDVYKIPSLVSLGVIAAILAIAIAASLLRRRSAAAHAPSGAPMSTSEHERLVVPSGVDPSASEQP
ncbi:MAG: TerC family protein [Chloroflexi bacterium]|nr:TerC family protein [Chloroflexota bacterium]